MLGNIPQNPIKHWPRRTERASNIASEELPRAVQVRLWHSRGAPMCTHNNRTWRLGILTVALALTAALAGCERTKISDINKNPGKFAGNEVTIAGKVTSSVASSNPGTFEVDDG